MKEAYRVVYHILLFIVIKIDYFFTDFHFYDILQALFFGIRSVFYVIVSSTIMQILLKMRYLRVYVRFLQVW